MITLLLAGIFVCVGGVGLVTKTAVVGTALVVGATVYSDMQSQPQTYVQPTYQQYQVNLEHEGDYTPLPPPSGYSYGADPRKEKKEDFPSQSEIEDQIAKCEAVPAGERSW